MYFKKLFLSVMLGLLLPAFAYSMPSNDDARGVAKQIISEIKQIQSGAGIENATGRELTHLLMEAKKNYAFLSKEDQDYLNSLFYIDENYFPDTYISPDGHFKIFYRAEGDDSIPWVDEDESGYPDLVENYARWFSYSLDEYMKFGLARPTTEGADVYKVYITDNPKLIKDGVLGYTVPQHYSPKPTGSYIVVRSDYKGYSYGKPAGYTDSVAAQITIIHEFMHGVQMAYSASNLNMFAKEGIAVWSEMWGFPAQNDPLDYVNNFYSKSNIGLNYDPRGEYNPDGNSNGTYYTFPYGSWTFFRYLTDRYGDELIKVLYDFSKSQKELQALNSTMDQYGIPLNRVVQNFWTTCITMSDDPNHKPYYFEEGKHFNVMGGASPRIRYNISKSLGEENEISVSNRTDIKKEDEAILNRLGAHYIRFIDKNTGTYTLQPHSNSDSLVLVICQHGLKDKVSKKIDFKVYTADAFAGQSASIDVPYNKQLPYTTVMVFNHNQKYAPNMKSWKPEINSAYYKLDFKANLNSVEDYINGTVNGFMIGKIFPTPAVNSTNIQLINSVAEELNVTVFDNLGRKIKTSTFFSIVGENTIPLNLDGVATGNYIIEVSNGARSERITFIKN